MPKSFPELKASGQQTFAPEFVHWDHNGSCLWLILIVETSDTREIVAGWCGKAFGAEATLAAFKWHAGKKGTLLPVVGQIAKLKAISFCRGKANLEPRMNSTRVPNNYFGGNSGRVESTEITGTNHARRVDATLSPSGDLPPPPYSDLFCSPPPYHEVVGRGVEFAEIPASQTSSIEQDIESAEPPSSLPLAQRRVETSISCCRRLGILVISLSTCLVFTSLAVSAAALLISSGTGPDSS